MRIDPRPGELWIYEDSSKIEREVLVLRATADGYVSYLVCHPNKKGACNVDFMGRTGTVYVDPRKIVFTHTANLEEKIRAIPDSKMDKVRSIIRQHLLLPAAEETDDLKARLSAAERSVIGMSERIKELTAQRDAYKDTVDRLIDKLPGQTAPEPEVPEPLSKIERNRLIVQENQKKYGLKQSYIAVKLKSVGMKQVTLDRLIGRSDGCVAHWVRVDSKVHWAVLERIFPGIEKEAEEWAKNQEEEKKNELLR